MKRVKSNHPCSICGKPDWCLYSEDGKVALCARVKDGSEKTIVASDQSELYKHILDPTAPVSYPQKQVPPPPTIAQLSLRNKIYSAICKLSNVTDYPEIRDHLLNRGFSLTECLRFGVLPKQPKQRDQLIAWVKEYTSVESFDGVPGFWLSKNQNAHLWHNYELPHDWLLLPYQTKDGLIAGLQYRKMDKSKNRYGWLNSKRYTTGATTGKLIHYCQPFLDSPKIAVTEGYLKGEIYRKYFPSHDVICIDGVNTGHSTVIETAKGKTLFIAFDQDWKTNKDVKHQLFRLLERSQSPTFIYEWDGVKGIDDALNKNVTIRAVSGGNVASPL